MSATENQQPCFDRLKSPSRAEIVRDAARRVPFTLTLLALFLACAVGSGALWRPLARTGLLRQVGYGLPALRAGRWWTLVAGIPFALYPSMLLGIAFAVIVFVGPYEYYAGPLRAGLTFALTQIGGALLAALVIAGPLAALGGSWGARLATQVDAGASAGAYGCAGALTAYLPGRWRLRARGALVAYLAGQLAITRRIWDIEHLLALFLGLGIGVAVLTGAERRVVAARDAAEGKSTWQPAALLRRQRGQIRALLAALIALAGISNILSALLAGVRLRIASWPEIIPFAFLHGTRTFVVVAGFGLLVLARGLWHGRRVAWLAALLLLTGSAVAHGIKGFNLGTGALQLALAALLFARSRDFRARPDTPTLADAARVAAAALLGLPAYATLGFLLLRANLRPRPTWDQAAREFLARLALDSTGTFRGTNFRAAWFLDSISFIWVAVALFVLVTLLRPVLRPTPESPHDRRRALELLRRWGGQSSAHMTTWPGNTLFLNGMKDAYLAYRVIGGVALVLGDPIGSPDGCERASEEFLDLCASRGWRPCFFGTSPRYLESYHAAGLRSLQIAQDTVIELAALEFRGKAWQDVRTALNRAEREGIRYAIVDWRTAPPDLLDQLRAISDAWTAEKGLPEMGFTLGGLAEAADPQVRTAVAIDGAGVVQGFTTWLPVCAEGRVVGWTIDLMRRRPGGFRGAMEFLVAQSALAMRAEGCAQLSLAAAPLARGARGAGGPVLQRLLDLLAERLEPFYNFASLHAFKQKFKPRWEPLYLVFPGISALPAICIAILRAYLPGLSLRDIADLLADVADTGTRRLRERRQSATAGSGQP